MNTIISLFIVASLILAVQTQIDKGTERLNTLRNRSMNSADRIIPLSFKDFKYLSSNKANMS